MGGIKVGIVNCLTLKTNVLNQEKEHTNSKKRLESDLRIIKDPGTAGIIF
jgi:hypothetical protein